MPIRESNAQFTLGKTFVLSIFSWLPNTGFHYLLGSKIKSCQKVTSIIKYKEKNCEKIKSAKIKHIFLDWVGKGVIKSVGGNC